VAKYFGFVLLCLLSLTARAESLHPHIVIILVDDMGYGDPGCFNSQSRISTPHIDSLAREGMKFTDAHAPGPLCHMSRFGLLTGQYPFRVDVRPWRERPLIPDGQMTIASLAQAEGYRTAMVGKWHLGFREAGYDKPLPGGPVDRGFDSFFGIRASTDIPPYFYIRDNQVVQPPTRRIEANYSAGWARTQGAFWRAGGIAPDLELKDVLPRFTDEAMGVIESHASTSSEDARPLMLYLAYPAPHTPWLPSEDFRGRSGAGMYGDFLMMVDAQIGRVLKSLDDAGMAEETLVLFSSDNGPCWYEADDERFRHDSSGGLRGMKADAWEGGHRMPFIARWPGHIGPGTSSTHLICFTDLLATFAELFDEQLPDDAGHDSFSFLPQLLRSKVNSVQRESLVVQAGSVKSMMSIRSGDWKLITGRGSGGFSSPRRIEVQTGEPEGQLYHLAQDPAESKNLYSRNPAIVARLSEELDVIVRAGRSRPVRSGKP